MLRSANSKGSSYLISVQFPEFPADLIIQTGSTVTSCKRLVLSVYRKMIREDWLRFTASSVRKNSALLMKRFGCHNLTLRFLFSKVEHIDSLNDEVGQHATISE